MAGNVLDPRNRFGCRLRKEFVPMARMTKWVLWQVALPLLGPMALSFVTVLAWRSGNPDFVLRLSIILDMSPWALTFYSLALVGSTMSFVWPKLSTLPYLGSALIAVAFAVSLYAAFMVIWRHSATFTPGPQVYGVAIGLSAFSIL